MVGVYNDVVSLAGLGGDLGYLDAAARLLGAEEAYRDITSYGGFGDTPIIREQTRQLLAARLDSRQRTRAWDAGRSLSTEQAVAEAISLAETLAAGVSAPPRTPPRPFALTPREAEILRLIVAGHSNAQIADALFISPRTATTHVSNILAKLGVETRTEAAVVAVRDDLF
jgi:DNA-binding CsgD family transcriptional regulator